MKKNESHSMDKISSELRETRSYNAQHEARDEKGRFTKRAKAQTENKAVSAKNAAHGKGADDCKCRSTLGSSYADEKYREGRSWNETRDAGKHHGRHDHKAGHKHADGHKHGHKHSDMENVDIVEVITITSYIEK